ncbi:H-2 class II histocompatibility antigen, E-S beta chain-like isoform X1 [Pygocentrus nattereri]|uniref:H-2 class II histocompatibility antigen, E-S beta chain-like isoform X1 n=1 Tax=Pygocentrus nattereri TaxID=42514 RepID=UPI0018917E5D|nr:H-2 class II histocompatibility antigen, E-S beta chain-like isoform X1 [Pygocentrus nattereri]XP_037392173.1 H-2 class II histocompatibility antigen, E-S beta chain-like isoform X1 [Pygocentrus nattereri]
MLLILQLLLALTLTIRTGGYYLFWVDECISSSLPDLTDVEYLRTYYFNKDLWVQFNSTVGKFVGFTGFGLHAAEKWNNSSYVKTMRTVLDEYCKQNLPLFYSSVLDKTVKPTVQLRSEQQAGGGHPAMLMCSAYDFYPPAIDVYWLRDGEKVTTDVISTEEMADGDWYYQIHSHLEHMPTSGEKISCVVEHASFKEPFIYDWDPSLPESERNKIAIGASGLVLGIILSASGFIYYKKKSSGRILVPS